MNALYLANEPALVLAIAASLDYWIGDPWGWPHPVRFMGWAIAQYTQLALQWLKSTLALRLAGIGLGIGLVGLSGLVGWCLVAAAKGVHPLVGSAIASILLASCLAGRSLRLAALEILQSLASQDLPTVRTQLSQYVGRDTATLSESDILRAVLETVTENATDGVMAPLFYALLGAALGMGIVPLALAYKAASTLDSMVGYREPPYTHLGWFSARMEDGLTWLPCRLTVLTLSLISCKPRHVLQICQRDAPQDASPNSGWSEAAYAAVLGVQLGGTNWYRGVAKHKPLLGDSIYPITPEKIEHALQLTRSCFLIWVGIFMAIWIVLKFLVP
ncbi:MAG: adenosylcobinamide-phosphate synthase CbiB [Leptolyngbyaceae bacterium]|nr:adenosylcobinamide-phosphate synthase CbiB [Leptolyngbyaceae bacterium]